MPAWQTYFLILYSVFGLVLAIKGFIESHKKNNAFGTVHSFTVGAYVWGDAVVFGTFWFLVSIVTLYLQDWALFWLVFSLFWLVRSIGETTYWFNEQHATKKTGKN